MNTKSTDPRRCFYRHWKQFSKANLAKMSPNEVRKEALMIWKKHRTDFEAMAKKNKKEGSGNAKEAPTFGVEQKIRMQPKRGEVKRGRRSTRKQINIVEISDAPQTEVPQTASPPPVAKRSVGRPPKAKATNPTQLVATAAQVLDLQQKCQQPAPITEASKTDATAPTENAATVETQSRSELPMNIMQAANALAASPEVLQSMHEKNHAAQPVIAGSPILEQLKPRSILDQLSPQPVLNNQPIMTDQFQQLQARATEPPLGMTDEQQRETISVQSFMIKQLQVQVAECQAKLSSVYAEQSKRLWTILHERDVIEKSRQATEKRTVEAMYELAQAMKVLQKK